MKIKIKIIIRILHNKTLQGARGWGCKGATAAWFACSAHILLCENVENIVK